jgi:hypothetical protein
VKRVDRRHQLSGPRRWAGAVRRVGKMALMHIDRDDGTAPAI